MFHPLPAETCDSVRIQWMISQPRITKYQEAIRLYYSGATQVKVPELKVITTTPPPSASNVGTGSVLHEDAVFFSWLAKNGMLSRTTDGLTEFICDYANRWHSALPPRNPGETTRNRHLPGTVPMFAYLPSSFENAMMKGPKHGAGELSKRFSREEFWQLRYLFIIVQSGSDDPGTLRGHVAICAISPEAKTIDYLCSGNDSGLARDEGSQCVESLICLLKEYLGDEPPLAQRFNPCDWKLRTGKSEWQDRSKPDCGMYTMSNIMCLAFGWDLSYGSRYGYQIECRRARLVSDLYFGGFQGYDPAKGADNSHYYPLNDITPSNSIYENFIPILTYPGLMICETLKPEVRRRSPTYYDCPDKETLYEHCARNSRFYPHFQRREISGPKISFAKFLSWVEKCDLAREMHHKVPQILLVG